MSVPLPSALRARFQDYIAEGLSGRAVALRLRLSVATGVRWQRKLHETGCIDPEPPGRPLGQGRDKGSYLLIKRFLKKWLLRMAISLYRNSLELLKPRLALSLTRLP